MPAQSPAKPQTVLIELYKGKSLRIGKTNGKLFGGIITFKEANPMYPVIWLGQKSYTIYDVPTKKNVLYYDTLSGMLIKPKDLSSEEDNIDMVAQTAQNFLLASDDAKAKLGIAAVANNSLLLTLAYGILLFILFGLMLYLGYSHAPVQGSLSGVVTTIAAGSKTTIPPTTTIYGLGGPAIVPVPTS